MYLRLDLYKFPPNHPVEPLGMYKNDPIVREQPEYIRSRHQNIPVEAFTMLPAVISLLPSPLKL